VKSAAQVAAAEGRVSSVQLRPLRARIEEIPFLFAKLVEHHCGDAPPPRLDPLLVESPCTHDWPFNVRELALLVRRLIALHPGAAVLERGMLTAKTEPRRMRPGPRR